MCVQGAGTGRGKGLGSVLSRGACLNRVLKNEYGWEYLFWTKGLACAKTQGHEAALLAGDL